MTLNFLLTKLGRVELHGSGVDLGGKLMGSNAQYYGESEKNPVN